MIENLDLLSVKNISGQIKFTAINFEILSRDVLYGQYSTSFRSRLNSATPILKLFGE